MVLEYASKHLYECRTIRGAEDEECEEVSAQTDAEGQLAQGVDGHEGVAKVGGVSVGGNQRVGQCIADRKQTEDHED